jgi:hypothetical protein
MKNLILLSIILLLGLGMQTAIAGDYADGHIGPGQSGGNGTLAEP